MAPTPVLWHGESHGQSSLVDSSPWGRKVWAMEMKAASTFITHMCISESLCCTPETNTPLLNQLFSNIKEKF